MKPNGRILILGGAETHEEKKPGILESDNYHLLTDVICQNKPNRLEFIIAGGKDFDETIKKYQDIFKKFPDLHADFMIIENRDDAENNENIERIKSAESVFFSGGDQAKIIEILQRTPLINEIKKSCKTKREFLVIGTSAGAMMLPEKMIKEGSNSEAQVDEYLKLADGLDFMNGCIIDTHFIQRGRFARLAHAVSGNANDIGIGLEENTALLLDNGKAWCHGQGTVVLIDGRERKESQACREKDLGYITNLKVHLLVAGCYFELDTLTIGMEQAHGAPGWE
ncbi:cyanophycinase [Legionella sp. MW5194]|uniref:cyanophycinase n=1 Tax=Legionella sp. MW5194 TaxID=2662448 RepID=UPI00193D89FD|nr:cyanophycinase [Legionella sp. MW5194]QRN04412.1 cyanophycinase [Legionella sp. MW5194]